MAETVKVPGIDKPLPKIGVYAGVAVTVVAILVYYRNQKVNAAGAAASSATGSTGLASGSLPSGVLAGDTSGAYQWDGTYGNPSDPYSMDSSTGLTYGNEGYYGGYGVTGTTPSGTLPGPPFSSNTQWSEYVLQQDAGAHPNMAEALGLYLDGKTLNANEQDLVYQAQAIAGPVPVQGAGGYPPKLRTASSAGNGHKGGKTFAANPVKGLRAEPGYYSITIHWDKDAHATGYQVGLRDVTGHRTASPNATTVATSYTFRNLTGGHDYEASVLARPAENNAKPATVRGRPAAVAPQQQHAPARGR